MQPYQILFPIGLFYAAIGALVWIFFGFGLTPFPYLTHASFMIEGFVFSFAVGFLMTAIPRFTGTSPATRWEMQLAAFVCLARSITPFFAQAAAINAAMTVGIFGLLMVFMLPRFRAKTFNPPPHFLFLGLGIAIGLIGSLLLLGIALHYVPIFWLKSARMYLYQGTLFCFIFGIGGRLITMLLGRLSTPMVQMSGITSKPSAPLFLWIQMALTAMSFIVEPWQMTVGQLLRALVATWIAFDVWKLYRLPKMRTRLTTGLWLAAWSLLVGLWLVVALPSAYFAALHVVFISGFGLMTLMIASRVTLSHGGHDMGLEKSSRVLLWMPILLAFAAFTRFTAIFVTGPGYTRHLVYAAIIWIVALTFWTWVFLPKILKSQECR
ncbi:MAG: NnrS family protein [Deltaproteobacteria bacterium]|nr:NnrS family protein [Deltaproteobacteria bacterium]